MEEKKTSKQTSAKGGKEGKKTTLEKLKENRCLILAGVIVLVFYLFLTLSDGALALVGLLFFVILFLI